jgi:hypothetical protein
VDSDDVLLCVVANYLVSIAYGKSKLEFSQ